MKDINSSDTLFKIYNLIAKVWIYLMDDKSSILGIRSFGQRSINNFNNLSDDIKEFHRKMIENISEGSTIYEGFSNIIDLEPNSKEKERLLLKFTIVLFESKENYIYPFTFNYPRFFSDSNINIVIYLDKNMFMLNIPTKDQDKSEYAVTKWFRELFIDITKICINSNDLENTDFIAAVLSGLFIVGALNISVDKIISIISKFPHMEKINKDDLEIQIQLLRNIQECNSPIICKSNSLKFIIEELEKIKFKSFLFDRYCLSNKYINDWKFDINSNE